MARVNLISNPSFDSGLVDWSALGSATLSISTAEAFYGNESMLITKSSASGPGVATANFIPVTPLLPYAASCYALVPITVPPSETTNVTLKIRWYTTAQVFISESVSTVVTLTPSSSWSRPTVIDTAPANAYFAKVSILQVGSGTAGEPFYVDAFLLEQSTYVGGYLDNVLPATERQVLDVALSVPEPSATYLPPLNADIILNNLVFNTIDENNVIWICTDIDGWWGQSTSDIPSITRGVEDGDYDVEGRYEARVMTFMGTFLPPTSDGVAAARDTLVEATNLVRQGGWLRTNESPTRAAFVRLSGLPSIVTQNARGRTDFSIPIKAADPIRYEWNDADPNGLTIVTILGTGVNGTVTNSGTTPVTAVFEVTGPMGSGSTIYNNETGETITILQPLRGTGPVGTVIQKEVLSNVATLTTTAATNFVVGDQVHVAGVGAPFDSVSGAFEVLAVSNVAPYTFSYAVTNLDIAALAASGTVSLAQADVLDIDTYNRSVSFNGDSIGYRSYVDTLTDWTKLNPGDNIITFVDSIDAFALTNKASSGSVVTLTTAQPHYMVPGDIVNVLLPTSASISNKAITSNVATLTTLADHGFSIGDIVFVTTSSIVNITNKSLTSNVAYITTNTVTPVSIGDQVVIAMPVNATIITKAISSNVATLTTATAHGFSVGDTLTVTIPTTASVTNKAVTSNVATLTTAAAHNFSVGDSITVTFPTTTTISNKQTNGTTVVLTTTTAHNFSVNDKISVALPTTATPTGTRSMAGASTYLVTITTSAAHNFVVGDSVLVDTGLTALQQVTTRSATSTTCTLTTATAHGYSTGQTILVSGVTSRYNGYAVITATTSTTFTWASTGSAESSIASSGLAQRVGTITNRSSTGTSCTLTTAATHNFTVGETIIVSGVSNSQYNGTFVITGVTTNTVTYAITGGSSESSTTSTGLVDDTTLTAGYNGIHYIETVPTSTTFTYLDYNQTTSISSTTYGGSPVVTDLTNTALNGTVTITAVPTTTSFSYTEGV